MLLYKPWVLSHLAFITEFIKLVAIKILVALAFYYFIHGLKDKIKDYILEKQNKKMYPHKLNVSKAEINSTDEFCQMTEEHGNIVEFGLFLKNIVIPVEYIPEFSNLPSKIFGKDQANKQTDDSYFLTRPGYLKELFLARRLSQLFSSSYFENIVKADVVAIDFYIKTYILRYGISFIGGTVLIEDVMDFMLYILSKNAYKRVFGSKLVNQPNVTDAVINVTNIGHPVQKSNLNLAVNIKSYLERKKCDKELKFLSEIIDSEIKNQKPAQLGTRSISLIQLLKTKSEFLEDTDPISLASALSQTFKSMVVISPIRLLNIFVDLSVDSDILGMLSLEQANIMNGLGKKIDLSTLSKMELLEKFIMKPLTLSCPASSMHRKTKESIVLSNGITLEKESVVSLNFYSDIHSNTKKPKTLEEAKNNNPNETKNDIKASYLWGFGSRSCPYAEYSLIQMKIIVAIFVRKYDIFAHAHETQQKHPGYEQISSVIPKSHKVFLKAKK